MNGDADFMTVAEFASLPAGARHAVWQACAERRVDFIPASAATPKGMRRYHRGQVRELLREAEAGRA